MAVPGRQGPWQPRGPGLLLGVVVLSVLALTVHFLVAVHLVDGAAQAARRAGDLRAAAPAAPVPVDPPPPGSTPSHSTEPTTAAPPSPAAPAQAPAGLDAACRAEDNPPTAAHIPVGDPFGADMDHIDGAELQRLYVVHSGELAPADSAGPVRECDRQLWALVTAVAPVEVLRYVDELLVFDADLTRIGPVGEMQSQTGSTEASSHWRLSLAPNGASQAEVAWTVAHEIGHLLSLSRGEMTGEDEASCQGTFILEGCLRDDSALLRYLDATWDEPLLDEWQTASDTPGDQERSEALESFYEEHHDRFVDSYAATEPTEDFAESFALWCAFGASGERVAQMIEGDPTDGSAKLAWFEQPANVVGLQMASRCQGLRALTG